jgi:hypothetical protein
MSRRLDLVKLHRQWRRDPWLLLEGFFWLGLARFTSVSVPFRWTIRLLGFKPVNDDAGNRTIYDTASLTSARRISRALRRAAANTPWESNCLTQALAGAGMLRLRQIAATLAMGVIRNSARSGGLEAHAWLTCGGITLTGGAGHRRYNAVATFTYGAKRTPSIRQCIDTRPSL